MAEDGLTFEWAALSNVGRLRSNNEDAVRIEPGHSFAVLADGMGGYNAGEVASHMAVEGISAGLIRWLQDASAQPEDRQSVFAALQALEVCVEEVNRAIFADACVQPDHAGMGTTLVVALAYRGQLLIGHIGDSRAYRWRNDELRQLTRDHSLLQEQIDLGLITLEQAARLRYRNLLTRGLGVEGTALLDTQAAPSQKGDIYLLCSDGLTDMVSDAEIAVVLNSGLSLPDMVQVLIDHANTGGGRDNVTAVLIRVAA